jgi:hypothetical protein
MDGTKKKRDNTLNGHQNCIHGLLPGQNLQGYMAFSLNCHLGGLQPVTLNS